MEYPSDQPEITLETDNFLHHSRPKCPKKHTQSNEDTGCVSTILSYISYVFNTPCNLLSYGYEMAFGSDTERKSDIDRRSPVSVQHRHQVLHARDYA